MADTNRIMRFLKRWGHLLFKCPSFWSLRPRFTCPRCGTKYRCYWDGYDIIGHGIDYCHECALLLEATEAGKENQK